METWFIIVFSLCTAALIKSLHSLIISSSSSNKNLPPGPFTLPIIGHFLWLRKSVFEIEPILRNLQAKYGPIVTLQIGSRPAIFIASHDVAHRALVQNGAVFSDRPRAVLTSNQRNISSAPYGPTWRLLRRNLTSEILHPSRIKSYSWARNWVLHVLVLRLLENQSSAVKVVDHFQYAMFCLLVLMCFGDKLDEKQIRQIEKVQRELLLNFGRSQILNFFPRIGKILFRKRWQELMLLRKNQEDVLIPLITARTEIVKRRQEEGKKEEDESVVAYVDTLMDLELPEEKRKLKDGEKVTICSEFLTAGTDTTMTALQWIMANLVKYPRVQAKLYEEITGVVGPPPEISEEAELSGIIKEEDMQKMKYLKAVVLEGLRRHPPGHFVIPHTVTEDVELEGYPVPKKGMVNFLVAEMGWDPKVWDEPMEFKPERFLTNTPCADQSQRDGEAASSLFDITGSKEIKMMPFGAGRRVCPGAGLALLHLEFFVANLVWYFEWKAVEGEEDLRLSY
ncbi:unnamed protein product [Thlaspi arvense]|uniref:Cytochrome P450 n=1 Tax=Thlaspi arvense TaxID=13288 RepID=A0AAU9RT48_THLAR|nr:unnamed protein product [Thlaspi arvense]